MSICIFIFIFYRYNQLVYIFLFVVPHLFPNVAKMVSIHISNAESVVQTSEKCAAILKKIVAFSALEKVYYLLMQPNNESVFEINDLTDIST